MDTTSNNNNLEHIAIMMDGNGRWAKRKRMPRKMGHVARGDKRLSNFMLWEMAYTELYFTDVLWPDFNEEELKKAINSYEKRERRYGRIEE